jgi:hypothetical protein
VKYAGNEQKDDHNESLEIDNASDAAGFSTLPALKTRRGGDAGDSDEGHVPSLFQATRNRRQYSRFLYDMILANRSKMLSAPDRRAAARGANIANGVIPAYIPFRSWPSFTTSYRPKRRRGNASHARIPRTCPSPMKKRRRPVIGDEQQQTNDNGQEQPRRPPASVAPPSQVETCPPNRVNSSRCPSRRAECFSLCPEPAGAAPAGAEWQGVHVYVSRSNQGTWLFAPNGNQGANS